MLFHWDMVILQLQITALRHLLFLNVMFKRFGLTLRGAACLSTHTSPAIVCLMAIWLFLPIVIFLWQENKVIIFNLCQIQLLGIQSRSPHSHFLNFAQIAMQVDCDGVPVDCSYRCQTGDSSWRYTWRRIRQCWSETGCTSWNRQH